MSRGWIARALWPAAEPVAALPLADAADTQPFADDADAVLDFDTLALQVRTAQDSAQPLLPISTRSPGFDLAGAYAVARRVHAARVLDGALPVGRKLGFTNAELWPLYGVREPIWAHVYDRSVEGALDGEPVECSLARFVEPKIQPGIVLYFARAPEPGRGLQGMLSCIDWIAHGIEIVQSHYADWKFQAADAVADGGLHGRLLVGPPKSLARLGPDAARALKHFSLELARDGDVCEVGVGSNVLGSPLAAALQLVELLASQPGAEPLRAGELVTTGTLTTPQPVRSGETWQTALRGLDLPGLTVRFVD